MSYPSSHKNILNASRMIVLHHPYNFDIVLFGKTLSKNSKTISGINIMSLDGESMARDIEFEKKGLGCLLFTDPYQASNMIGDTGEVNRDNAQVLIEMMDSSIEVEKGDVLYLLIGDAMGLAYEVVEKIVPIGIPSLMMGYKYELNRRDELNYTENLEL